MRCPSFSSLKSSSTGIPGYGEPPRVKISHISTPNDHLNGDKRRRNTERGLVQSYAIIQANFLTYSRTTECVCVCDLHVALVCVDSVKQSLWCHPLHRQPSLQGRHGNIRAPPSPQLSCSFSFDHTAKHIFLYPCKNF